jgi:hypothetical protein
VINSILAGANGAIAVQFVEWSGSAQQAVVVNWFLINDSITANAFADAIAAAVRTFSGLTGISAAIDYGANLFAGNGYDGTRQVIDIAGDGTENEGGNVAASRNAALALGIDTINGITIGGSATVSSFYVNNVIGGTNAFQLDVNDFGDFAAGIEAKLIREIRQVSTPATILLFSGVLLGFVVRRRKSY